MPVSRRQTLALAMALLLGTAVTGFCQTSGLYAPGGVAIGGYDPVAYFSQGQAIEGSADFMLKWHGAIWMFSSAANMEAFEMDPAAYVPQYGGYCAYGVGEGVAANSDPQVFVVQDGRLYLYSSKHSRSEMQSDFPAAISLADRQWKELRGK